MERHLEVDENTHARARQDTIHIPFNGAKFGFFVGGLLECNYIMYKFFFVSVVYSLFEV